MSGMIHAAKKAYLAVRRRWAPAQTIQPVQMRAMEGHTSFVMAAAFFNDSRRVVTGSWDQTLRIWDVQKGELVGGPFEGHKKGVRSVAVSPDDRQIASGGDDNTIIMWDVESKKMVFDPLVKHTAMVSSVCFSPDGKRLASGSSDSTVVVWDANTGAVLATLHGHHQIVHCVTFSPDGLNLASGSSDHTIRVWRTSNAKLHLEIDARDSVRSVVWSPDGQQLVSASHYDQNIKFWNSSNGNQIGRPCIGHTGYISSLAISFHESFIATASDDRTVRLWDTKAHQQIGQALQHTARVRCIAISPNGELLVSGDGDKVLLWSIKVTEQDEAEGSIKDDEEAQSQQLPTLRDTQLHSNDTSDEPTSNDDSASTHSLERHQAFNSDDNHLLFDFPAINTTVHNSCISGDLPAAEKLLTQDIDADSNNYNAYATRSVVRAQNSEWDKALQDSGKSIAIQPSLWGYISKGIAHCGNQQFSAATEAFDLAFVFSNRGALTIGLLLLIKAVALFNASRRDEAIRRVQDLATAHQDSDTLLCSVVDLYLRVRLAIISFEDGRYSETVDQLNDTVSSMTDLFSHRALFEPKLKIFTVLFGWDMDSLWQTVHQRQCDALLHTDQVIEAVESYQYMMRVIDEDAKDSDPEWSIVFKQNLTAHCIAKGDEAVSASNYERAIELYSTGIGLDSSCESLFAHRSKANLERHLYVDALSDADRVVELNPSSYLGYELKYAVLHAVQRYDEAFEAINIMLSKLDNTSSSAHAHIQKLHQQYVSPSEVENMVQRAINTQLENAPLRLLNTSTGRIYNREAQINAFMESKEYEEILPSSMTYAPLQEKSIKKAVAKYFSWVMLSHRWESGELLLHDIQDKVVYDLDPVGMVVKLQKFCEVARDAGYRWAWSDTCCIDQNNHVELQRSVNSMFVWYRQSALTIVYLSDVLPSTQSGALAKSAWNTRGWTVQEFLAPNIILFYQKDWTLYLNDRSPNHKESATIMKELKDSTGIDALVAFRPGMAGAREKLQWASMRVTTLQEDIAYSLFGIFGVHLPVIYGEMKQNALGRLLQEIVAQSGDITALDWAGKPSEFNSCLPADISSYKLPPCTPPSLSDDQIQTLASSLRNAAAVELYTKLTKLSAPRFANRRLQLPCIIFPVTKAKRRSGQDREPCFTYDVQAGGLHDLLITTGDRLKLSNTKSTRQTFLLIRPWNRYDLGLPDPTDETQSMNNFSELASSSSESLGRYSGDDESVVSVSQWRASKLMVRLGQPFGALLLVQQRGGEFKRIASDHNIIAQVKDVASVQDMMDARTLEIL